MSWAIDSIQGDAAEIKADLETEVQNEREDKVLTVVKTSIDSIVESLQGYISISAHGHVNPATGEIGDVIDIHIVSLPVPSGPTPAETPITVESTSTEPAMSTEEAVAKSAEGVAPVGAGEQSGLETPPISPEEAEVVPVVDPEGGGAVVEQPVITPETPVTPIAEPAPPPAEPAQSNPVNTESPPSPVPPVVEAEGTPIAETPGNHPIDPVTEAVTPVVAPVEN